MALTDEEKGFADAWRRVLEDTVKVTASSRLLGGVRRLCCFQAPVDSHQLGALPNLSAPSTAANMASEAGAETAAVDSSAQVPESVRLLCFTHGPFMHVNSRNHSDSLSLPLYLSAT